MEMKWTPEQQKVIELRDRNILVSAAAGSGKTAVLVERILGKLTRKDHPIDIDQLLIVTFTRAAAGEMRERLTEAVENYLEQDPENEHLQRQQTLIHNAQRCLQRGQGNFELVTNSDYNSRGSADPREKSA